MKVIILAGGWGTRLGQQAEDIPKPMVPIGNKPILWHIMKIYSAYGFNDFIISLGVKANVIKNYFINYENLNNDFTVSLSDNSIKAHESHDEKKWKVTLAYTGLNTLKGARVKRVAKYLDSDINMLTYGDGVSDIKIDELLKFHKAHKKMLTISAVHPPARFGEIIESKGILTFQEKPQMSQGLINGGFMVFNREFLEHLNEDEKCDLEKGPMEEIAKQGQIMVYRHSGMWECIDHERDVAYLNNLWRENKAFWKVWK